MKRANGTGQVYKINKPLRKPWCARTAESYDAEGRRTPGVYIGYYATKKEALSALDDFYLNPTDVKIKLKDVYEQVSQSRFKKLSKQSVDGYHYAYKHLEPLYDSRFASLKTADYQRVLDACQVGSATKKKVKVLLSLMYDYAMANDIANKDYSQFITIKSEPKKERDIFTADEIKALYNANNPVGDALLFMIYTGLRVNEMLSLTPGNIKDGCIVNFGNKTEEGKSRIVPINSVVSGLLERGLVWKVIGIDASNFRRSVKKFVMAIGMEYKTPHSCRHTFATMLGESGVSTLDIQKLLGHTDYSTTANIYSHPTVENLKKAIDSLTIN